MSRHARQKTRQAPPAVPIAAGSAAPACALERPAREQAEARAGAAGASDGPQPAVRPGHEQIAVRAYHLWEAQGRPDGNDCQHWLEAERQLDAEAR